MLEECRQKEINKGLKLNFYSAEVTLQHPLQLRFQQNLFAAFELVAGAKYET